MKHLYLLLPAVLFSFIASGQPVISNVVPNFGDQFVLNQVDFAPSPGEAGANITWDFSNETITEYSMNYIIKTPNEVDGGDDFPDATMVWEVDMGFAMLHSFMSFDNNTFTDYGTISAGPGMAMGVAYSDPIEHFTYPLAYQDSGSDDYIGSGFGVTDDNDIEGTQSYIVDGYGTLITPFETYENVLRVSTTAIETIAVLGSAVVIDRTVTSWYSPDYPVPVMVIGIDESSSPGMPLETSETMTALASYTSTSTGLNERDNPNTFSLYPNPTTDQITIKTDGLNANSTLNIYSANGKLVKEVSLNGNENVDVSALSPGIYIAVLRMDGQRYTQKPFSVVR